MRIEKLLNKKRRSGFAIGFLFGFILPVHLLVYAESDPEQAFERAEKELLAKEHEVLLALGWKEPSMSGEVEEKPADEMRASLSSERRDGAQDFQATQAAQGEMMESLRERQYEIASLEGHSQELEESVDALIARIDKALGASRFRGGVAIEADHVEYEIHPPQDREGASQLILGAHFGNKKVRDDMPIAIVSVAVANLRSGPGENYDIVRTAETGTRLAIVTRRKEWYHVITGSGKRVWAHSSVLGFGRDYRSIPTGTVSVSGYIAQPG